MENLIWFYSGRKKQKASEDSDEVCNLLKDTFLFKCKNGVIDFDIKASLSGLHQSAKFIAESIPESPGLTAGKETWMWNHRPTAEMSAQTLKDWLWEVEFPQRSKEGVNSDAKQI